MLFAMFSLVAPKPLPVTTLRRKECNHARKTNRIASPPTKQWAAKAPKKGCIPASPQAKSSGYFVMEPRALLNGYSRGNYLEFAVILIGPILNHLPKNVHGYT